jgi:hypothetical protein
MKIDKIDANKILCEHGPDALRNAFDNGADPFADARPDGSDATTDSITHKLNGKAGAKNRFEFVLFDDIDDLPKQWLAAKMLGAGDAAVLYGEPGCGKSVLAGDLGMHVAAGMPWHGRAVLQGAVLYIALERSQLVKRRARAFGIKHNVRALPFAVIDGVINFRNSQAVAFIINTVRAVEEKTEQKVVLVIIDTVSRALFGGDENSSKDRAS